MADTIIETPRDDYIVVVEEDATVIQVDDPTVIVTEDTNVIEHEVENVVIIETGIQGPAGPPGPTGPQGPAGEESVPLAKQIDWIDDEHVYIGEANPGTATSAASWRIKYTVFQSDDDASITWADGDDSFDNIWDNRASYSYS